MSTREKNFKNEKFKVKVPNTDFYLEANKTYRIIGKVDSTAPRGFQERGITKFEHPLNTENANVFFDPKRNLWDTGLYANSPCYQRMKGKDIDETIDILEKHLVPHLQEMYPEGALSQKSDNKFWDSYMFKLNQNLTISTSTPKTFFGLWISLLSGRLAPEVNQKAPRYRDLSTPYVIIDSAEKASTKQKSNFAKSLATTNFINGITSESRKDRKLIIDVLNYVGFRAAIDTEDSILNSSFQNWISNSKASLKNAEQFNTAFKKFNNEEGKEELEIYKKLKKAVDKKLIEYTRGEYYFEGESIGTNLKDSAEKINKNDNLKGKLLESFH